LGYYLSLVFVTFEYIIFVDDPSSELFEVISTRRCVDCGGCCQTTPPKAAIITNIGVEAQELELSYG